MTLTHPALDQHLTALRRLQALADDSPHAGRLAKADLTLGGEHRSCGDQLTLQFALKGGRVQKARFVHSGCAISAASAAALCAYAEGKSLAKLKQLTADECLALLDAPISPARVPCALLACETLHATPSALHITKKSRRG